MATSTENKRFEQTLDVNVKTKKGSTYYLYTEALDEHKLKCVLKVEENRVKIRRRGVINMNFTFVKDTLTDTFYESLAGRHHFFVHTNDIQLNDNVIHIDYDLYEGDEKLGNYKYTLKKEEK
ncbi:DUF1934 domain-containing protein [Phocicoccus pinnipedialis]|uniref:DUF1934 domain-containing protein n=1 Tax=Phocicoccus pinnipedialis TaxID=110845 RepID=UPI00163E1777